MSVICYISTEKLDIDASDWQMALNQATASPVSGMAGMAEA
ncbi:hypothetical protein [Oceanicoccus sagamiensis]|nr:hypothetical protein [Oceanicoccus sagamiensis]